MNVLVYGFGLMGKKVAHAVRENQHMNLVGVVSPVFDEKVEEGMFATLEECHEKVDTIIDFSHPNNLEDILRYGVKNHCHLVIATTGYNSQQLLKIEEASSQIPIFQSYNTSFGISMLMKIVKMIFKMYIQFMIVVIYIKKEKNKKLVFNQFVLEQSLVNILFYLLGMMKLLK